MVKKPQKLARKVGIAAKVPPELKARIRAAAYAQGKRPSELICEVLLCAFPVDNN